LKVVGSTTSRATALGGDVVAQDDAGDGQETTG
jgi:hypothetical protein